MKHNRWRVHTTHEQRLKWIIYILLFMHAVAFAGYKLTQWRQIQWDKSLVSPVPLTEKVYAEQAPVSYPREKARTHLEVIDGLKHRDVIVWVLGLESTFGERDWCKNQGRFNGFGYRQNSKERACFDSFEEVARLVDRWFDVQLRIKTLPQALCYYNTGIATTDCEYYKNYLALKGGK